MVEPSPFPTPDEQPTSQAAPPDGGAASGAEVVSDEQAVSEEQAQPAEPLGSEEGAVVEAWPVPEAEAVVAAPADDTAQAVAAAPAPVAPSSGLSATLEAPAIAAEPGGEWDLLVARVREWIGSGEPQKTFRRYSSPLQAAGLLLGVVLLLRLYGALLGAIDGLPLVPGLLELVGVIWLTKFSLTNLVRSNERQRLFQELQQRWSSFRGKS